MRRQCELLGLPRSTLYSPAGKETEENLRWMRLIDELYLTALGRMPTSAEWKRVSEHIEKAKDKQRAVEDALWAILNTREFLFNH